MRNKDADYLNMLGEELAKKYNNLTYVHADFKKNNGQDIGVDLSKKLAFIANVFVVVSLVKFNLRLLILF
ncbi:MAG: hypothetical protein IJ186_03740 [Bacilli bacterium]|nr:hypothetical protein [Bacilli bacterium]